MSSEKRRSATLKAGALVGTVALVGSGVAMAACPAIAQPADDVQASVVRQSESAGAAGFVQVDKVEGAFTYSQDVVTSNASIASTFRVAAASLCSSMPQYIAAELDQEITVGGPASSSQYIGTVADMANEEGATAFTMACSCASNLAGGGAIANANVSGVSLASVASMVGAL